MANTLKLMAILAHPDDETLGFGGALAKYAAEGVETYLITATRGERGWPGDPADYPGLEGLGKIREGEVRAAADILGIRDICFLDYIDGDLDQADTQEAVAKIVAYIRKVRPQVVITFAPDGAYGHPDHIAISQLTAAALVAAADSNHVNSGQPHTVSKLYHKIDTQAEADLYLSIFDDIVMNIDGVDRRVCIWQNWAVTTWIRAGEYGDTMLRAVACHRSQMPNFEKMLPELEKAKRPLCDLQTYLRVYSLVNGGRGIEDDLFAGLR